MNKALLRNTRKTELRQHAASGKFLNVGWPAAGPFALLRNTRKTELRQHAASGEFLNVGWPAAGPFALFLVMLTGGWVRAQDPLLWGGLEPGPYGVGFRSSIELDHSRKYDGKARPILLDVWYPTANAQGSGLAYGDYLRVPAANVHPWFNEKLEAFVRDVLADDLFHKKELAALNETERAAYGRLMTTRTSARDGASPAAGKFPLLLYHSGAGGSYEDNSVLFEYLASHGYVVVSSAFQSPDPRFIGNNRGWIQRSGPDFDFLIATARRWEFVDSEKIGVMGHSAGAQILLLWIGSRKSPAGAAVSLDTTAEYDTPGTVAHKYLFNAMRKLPGPKIPILLFASQARRPRFENFDRYLSKSPRYEAAAAELRHDDFLTHGFLGRALMNSPDADAVRKSYEQVCRTIRRFFDATLNKDAESERLLQQGEHGAPVSVRFRPALSRAKTANDAATSR